MKLVSFEAIVHAFAQAKVRDLDDIQRLRWILEDAKPHEPDPGRY
jgi:hypothetical protein